MRCAEWREISPGWKVWTLPQSRNKLNRESEVPLSATLDPVTRVKADLDALSGVSGWVFHDIRRTVRSNDQGVTTPEGEQWHSVLVQQLLAMGTRERRRPL